jgi:hypothetical protein
VRSVGDRLIAGNAADQIGHLVVKAVRQDGIRVLGNGIPDNARLGGVRQSGGLLEPSLNWRVKPNAFHATIV